MPKHKMERFTSGAKHVLSLTQLEAEQTGHGSIDTEHLLLGLLREDGGIAGRVLRDLNVEGSRTAALIAELKQTSAQSTSEALDLTQGMKRVLELAVDEARRMGHHYISTEHLLLGLVRQNNGMAIDVLKRLGISPEDVRRQARRVLQQERTQAEQLSPLFQLEFIERFQQRAKFALSLALDYAEQMQHGQIDTGHLLVGLMREENGVAGQVLRDLGLEQKRLEAVVKKLTQVAPRAGNQALDLSPDLKQVLEIAVREARRIPSPEVGTEALLLALVQHEDNVAINVLEHLGISPDNVQRQIFRILQASQAKATQPKPMVQTTGGVIAPAQQVRPDSISYQILQVTILRVLYMIEAQKLSVVQGAELLSALHPWLLPTPGESLRLVSLFKEPGVLEKRKLRLTITDNTTNTVQFDLVLPLSKAIHEMDVVLNAALNNQAKDWLWTLKGNDNKQIDIRIDEDAPPSAESNIEDNDDRNDSAGG